MGTSGGVGFAPLGTPSYIAKPLGNGTAGIVQWIHDDSTGYLWHLRTGPNSTSDVATVGIGTDKGAGNGILVSHKNAGEGFRMEHNPGAGTGLHVNGYGTLPVQFDVHAGAGPVTITAQTGQGYSDGVTTLGSPTTFTSATATFVPGDVGATLTQLTSRALNDPTGCIPASTTITAYISATQVTMSNPAGFAGTGIIFRVGSRVPAVALSLLKTFDTDGTTPLVDIRRDSLVVPIGTSVLGTSTRAATTAQYIRTAAGQLRMLVFQTGTLDRWQIRANSTAESGSDVGSDLEILSRTDAGGSKTTVISISRSTGTTTVAGNLTTSNGTFTSGANALAGTAYLVVNAAAGQAKTLSLRSAGSERWLIRSNSTAEGGSNVGSDLEIVSRDDSGAFLATILTIARATGQITINNGSNLALGTSTGTKIGTATTQKIGFYNATPVAQPSAYTQTYATADKTLATPTAAAVATTPAALAEYGFTQTQADGIVAAINALRLDHLDLAQYVNSVVDDLQSLGLVA